jgi:O-antigen/teichoic acid export membrane protein
VRRLLASPTLRTVGVYGAAGAGFAVANVVLARVLPTAEYAVVTLVMALLNIGFYVAPAGLDGVVNRRPLEAGPRLLRQTLVPAVAAGALFALIAAAAYDVGPALAALTFISVTSGGALIVAAAQFQSEHRFTPSLALLQSTNLVLLLAAVLTAATGAQDATLPIYVVTVGTVGCALWGWIALFRERHAKPHRSADVPWRDAFAFLGMQLAGVTLIQLERLVLPYLLPLHELATYGVLAAVAGSLFRVLQMGVGYSLLPRLRQAPDLRQRRRLVAREARLVAGIAALGAGVIVVAVPLVERWFLAGKYDLTGPLVLAMIVSGVAKIANSFTKAAGTAMATARELSLANLLGWLTVAIALAGAVIGAEWGLVGVIYGVALGWALRAATFAVITARHLAGATPPATAAAGVP